MVYAILLDDDQPSGGDRYAVRFHGSLAACRAQTDFDADAESWTRREYQEISSEPKSLRDGSGETHSGRIAGFRITAAAFARATAASSGGASGRAVATGEPSGRRRPTALILLGIALGGALAFHRARRRSDGDRT